MKNQLSLELPEQVAIVEAITKGIQLRGKGQRGDKTMLDTWIPAMEVAVHAKANGLTIGQMWRHIVVAGAEGAQSTRSMVATRGRAARLGERSLGHMDPGARSSALIVGAVMDVVERRV